MVTSSAVVLEALGEEEDRVRDTTPSSTRSSAIMAPRE
jgi:hypothetical protein